MVKFLDAESAAINLMRANGNKRQLRVARIIDQIHFWYTHAW